MRSTKFALSLLTVISLVACGGGGGGAASITGSTAVPMNGMVSQGAPIADASILITDSKGKTIDGITTDANGAYTIADISGLTAPLLVGATGYVGGKPVTYYGLLQTKEQSNYANVSPLTDAILSQAMGKSPSYVEQNAASELSNLDAGKVDAAKNKMILAISDVMDQITPNSSKNFDPFKSQFKADGASAEDKINDLLKVVSTATATGVEITVTDKSNSVGSVQFSSTSTAAKLPTLPTQVAQMKFTGVKGIAEGFTYGLSSIENLNSSKFTDGIENDFLSDGEDKAAILQSLSTYMKDNLIGAKVSNPTIQSCDTNNVCKISLSVSTKDETSFTFTEYFKYYPKTDTYKSIGNQYRFGAEFGSTASKQLYDQKETFGVSIQFTINKQESIYDKYKTASVDLKSITSSTPDLSYNFKLKPSFCSPAIGRYYDGMPLDDNTDNCDTWKGFDPSNQSKLKEINEKIKRGGYVAVFKAWKTFDKSDTADVVTVPITDLILTTDMIASSGYPNVTLNQANGEKLPYLSIANARDFVVTGSLCITSNQYCNTRLPEKITTILDPNNIQLPQRIDANAKDGWLTSTKAQGYFVHVKDKFNRDLIISGDGK
jgi:hypothetical protein